VDTLGHDSLYDYDPVWAKCVELGVVPAFHGIGYGWGSRVSHRNYVYNHLGNFGVAQEAACRSLLMGGVPKRFPGLSFAFLEGGVSWACQLYADVLGHYEKRNKDVVSMYDDSQIDTTRAVELFEEFSRGRINNYREEFQRGVGTHRHQPLESDGVNGIDDFAESLIQRPEDIVDVFTRQFNFGCEADDPMNALAFNRRLLPHGARLNAVFASDIGHWDVPDMREVLAEAWELVEDGHMTEEDFREFTCGNAMRMLTSMNPRFFEDTVVSDAARALVPVPA
jgi:SAM-dependent methyltransferase